MNMRGDTNPETISRVKQEIDASFPRGMAALGATAASRATTALPAAACARMLNEYRSRYMRGLVKFLKNDAAGAKEMYAAVTGVELAQGCEAQRGFWWVVLAFFESLIHGALPTDVDARPFCNGVEQRIRRLAESPLQAADPQNSEQFLRDMLYAIARSEPVSDRLRGVQDAFRPEEGVPGEAERLDQTGLMIANPNSVVFRPESSDSGRSMTPSTPDMSAEDDHPADFVEIAGEQVSKSLFDLFREEVREHVATLKTEFEVLKGHGVITDAMLLAVHSLSGVAGTVRFDNLRDLCVSFARALAPLSRASLSGDEEDLIEQAIEATEKMVVEALGLAEPTPNPELIDRLEAVAAGAAPEATPIEREPEEVMLPEEEAAIGRGDEGDTGGVPAHSDARESYAGAVQLDDQPAGGRPQRRMSDDVDSDLMPAFLDDANRLVPQAADALQAWRADPSGHVPGEKLNATLQNLKGSARMAGVMSVGELCQHMGTRVEAALGYASAPTSLIEELLTSMSRMGVLFDRLQPQGGAAVNAARRVAPTTPATESAVTAQSGAGETRHPAETAPRLEMLRVRADLIDQLVDGAIESAAARKVVLDAADELRLLAGELTQAGLRLRARLPEIETVDDIVQASRGGESAPSAVGHRNTEPNARQLAESADDVDVANRELQSVLEDLDRALSRQSGEEGELWNNLLRLRMLPLTAVAERLHRVVRRTAKELDKRANLDMVGGQVEVDRSVLDRMVAPLEQLLRNAIEHGIEPAEVRTAAGKLPIGEIIIEAALQGDEIRVTISDDGAGLNLDEVRARAQALDLIAGQSTLGDEQIAALILEPGFSRDKAAGGLGGVRSVLAAFGGVLSMTATNGKGMRFELRIPRTLSRLPRQPAAGPGPQVAEAGAGSAPMVLVVDDSYSVRVNTTKLFSAAGYRVIAARDGVEALERMLNEVPAVLVLDADMPRMDGIELTRKIRANARLEEMPVILLSSNLSEDRQVLARDIGVDHFLGKPCHGDELLRHVAGFIAAVRSSE